MAKLVTGINDLKTLHPDIAAEADGWDPTTVVPGSHKKMSWKCKKGHQWATVINKRTKREYGCPYCSNQRVLKGFNDLNTKFPEIAKEADGWDPSTLVSGSNKKMPWICKKGHTWETTPNERTGRDKTGCPYCSNKKLLPGFNDLKTKSPEIAKEANGWDPSTVVSGSNKKMPWICKKGHTWKTTVNNRTGRGDECPYCVNKKVWAGFNDLKTKSPEIAKEADGWDPSTVVSGSNKKMPWICKEGHKWKTSPAQRTDRDQRTGCPSCAEYGFNPEKPAWFYLLKRKGEQKFGITNSLKSRMKTHASSGWQKIESIGPNNGQKVLDTENALKEWLKEKIGLVPNKQENWYTSKMEVHSLAELKEKSGIKTSIF